MPKKMLIDATHPEETRVVVADGNKVEDFDFESINKRQLAGNIYLAKVTRVEPSLQAAFVEYGGNRHGFLAFSEIHPDYYQIPVADREALLAEEEQDAKAEAAREDAAGDGGAKRQRKSRRTREVKKPKAETEEGEKASDTVPGEASDEAASALATKPKGRGGRRQAKGRAKPAPTAGSLEVIDLAASPAPEAAEEPGAVPKGLEVADPGDPEAQADSPPETPSEAIAADAGDLRTAEAADVSEDAPDTSQADAPDPSDAPDPEAPGAGDTGESGPKSMAESAGLDDETVTEEIAEAAAPEVTAAEAPAEAPGDPSAEDAGEGEKKPARRTRSRRGGRSKSRSRDKETSKSADTGESSEDGEDEAKAESQIEQSGADDPREEVIQERAVRRRRYKIQDVVKVRQIMLVQVVKEERGNKGAALTTYLSLAGRYGVLMPNTARGGGISRKITNAPDRKRLREIVGELDVPRGMGLIVRTAGAERTRPEIKRDYEFLLRQWEQIRDLTLKSIAPCLIYEEGSLIKRVIRDVYNKEIEVVLVEGEAGYREAKDYMKMLMPSHAKNVKQYADPVPLFIRYQVESYLNGMFSPTVQLKSGGYIVIGITEALVAIDVNSGRSTKEGSVEDTALKTNLEAADEIARQLRLRDLAGLIVIDFIDMDENRNNRSVEKRMKERLKTDRARIQLGRISAFGLMEMSRQRLRPGMLEASTMPCPHCHGTGIIRSDESLSLAILREVEEESLRDRTAEVIVTCPVSIANFLINSKRAHVARIEERHDLKISVFGDHSMVSPDYKVERVRAAGPGRGDPAPSGGGHVTASGSAMSVRDESVATEDGAGLVETPEGGDRGAEGDGDDAGKRRRRGKRGGRRRRRGGEDRVEDRADQLVEGATDDTPAVTDSDRVEGTSPETPQDAAADETAPTEAAEEKPKRRSRGGRTRKPKEPEPVAAESEEPVAQALHEAATQPETEAEDAVADETASPAGSEAAALPDTSADAPPEEPGANSAPTGTAEAATDDDKPKKRGWWTFGF